MTSASACEPDAELVRLLVSASPAPAISVSSSLPVADFSGGVQARVAAASHGASPIPCSADGPPTSAMCFSPGLISGSSTTTARPDESKSGPGRPRWNALR